MTTVLVLGTTGMLGSVVYKWLRSNPALRVLGTVRRAAAADLRVLDAESVMPPDLQGIDWVVNCIGIIKPFIHDDNRDEVARAIRVNALFPLALARAAEDHGARVLQVATDCVYSGRDGCYDERAPHDPTDVYGKSKSLGEVRSPNMMHLRCSIIGPEVKGFVSLLSWFLGQQPGATVSGYRNHHWNGLTTLHFAKVCEGIIRTNEALAHLQHVIPGNDITKAALLRVFAREYQRTDITIRDVDADPPIDRRLRTANAAANDALWRAAGYARPQTIEEMVHEMATFALT